MNSQYYEKYSFNEDTEDEHDDTIGERANLFLHQNFEQIILSIFWRSGKIGAAVYSTESNEVQLLNDVADVRPDFQICKHLFHEIKPTTVITCNTVSPLFLECVKFLVNQRSENSTLNEPSLTLAQFSSKYFKYDRCKIRILNINVISMKNLLEENRSNFLQSLINFNCRTMISAFGALLYFLDTYISKILLQIPSQHILSIKILNLEYLVWIDEESYNALEIFSSTNHPSAFKWTNGAMKEGFSIYGLFNRCSSKIGAQYMKILLSHPIKNIIELENRHEVIEFFLRAENNVILKNLQDCLKNIRNISTIISRIIGTQATPAQWKMFYKTIHNAIIIGEICRSRSEQVKFFKEIGDSVDNNLHIITRLMETVIDFEASEEQGKFTVKKGAVPELDEIKEQHKNLPNIMESVAEKELSNLPNEIESCSLIYLPEIGYLLGIPVWKENLTESELILPNMNFKFMLNNVAHYKTVYCEEMDEVLGDCHLIVLKHETEIMCQIVEYIHHNLNPVTIILDKIKLLDCLISFSDVAKEFDLVKPKIVTEQIINIKNGRHILQQLCVDTFVANDFVSTVQDSLIKIFTGPNSSGKSVYLKQVALIVYLAHIGSFIPAEEATIGLIDYLHTRIHATESISTGLSSFMLDLRQMYSCLYNSTPNTLIVIDEFGKGTADTDGLALLAACARHFMDRELNCPHILISTHFHSLLTLLPESNLIKAQTLEFLLNEENITYLYKVKNGSTLSSFAFNAAMNVGFDKRIINRGNEIFEIIKSGGTIQPQHNNLRLILMNRRKECLRKIVQRKNEEDLQEIIDMLNKIRY